jgi:hypothetical protein
MKRAIPLADSADFADAYRREQIGASQGRDVVFWTGFAARASHANGDGAKKSEELAAVDHESSTPMRGARHYHAP